MSEQTTAVRQRRYSKEELAQRGQALYESSIRQQVEAENKGKIVAINLLSKQQAMAWAEIKGLAILWVWVKPFT